MDQTLPKPLKTKYPLHSMRKLKQLSGKGHLLSLGLTLLCIGSLSSCSPETEQTSTLGSTSQTAHPAAGQPEQVFKEWKQHIWEETSQAAIQKDGCWPAHFAAQGPSKGIVVLIHGFTACPQQFFDVAPMIAAKGYDVFLPLMPGQGRVTPPGAKEDFNLPKGDTQLFLYHQFVKRINYLASESQGTRVIGGLSGGAALAAGAAIEAKHLWNRALIMAPLFKFSGSKGTISAVADVFHPSLTIHYGAECSEGQKKPGGRRGLCEVTVASMRTMLGYGLLYRNRMQEFPHQIQFVGAEEDPTVDNETIYQSFLAHQKTKGKSRFCLYRKGVPHSMMSRKENLTTGHWWMNSLEQDLTRFVTEGVWFPIDASAQSSELGAERCLVDD